MHVYIGQVIPEDFAEKIIGNLTKFSREYTARTVDQYYLTAIKTMFQDYGEWLLFPDTPNISNTISPYHSKIILLRRDNSIAIELNIRNSSVRVKVINVRKILLKVEYEEIWWYDQVEYPESYYHLVLVFKGEGVVYYGSTKFIRYISIKDIIPFPLNRNKVLNKILKLMFGKVNEITWYFYKSDFRAVLKDITFRSLNDFVIEVMTLNDSILATVKITQNDAMLKICDITQNQGRVYKASISITENPEITSW